VTRYGIGTFWNYVSDIYLSQMFTLLSRSSTFNIADVPARYALRATSSGNLVVPWTRRRIGDKALSEQAVCAKDDAVSHYFLSSPTENLPVPVWKAD